MNTDSKGDRISRLMAELAELQADSTGTLADQLDREEALKQFIDITGLHGLIGARQRGRDPQTARYTLMFADGSIVNLKNVNVLWSQTEFGKVLFVALSRGLPVIKRNDWHSAVTSLLAIIDVDEIDGEAFEDDVAEWLDSYRNLATSDEAGAAPHGMPYTQNGRLHISASHFAKYISREYSQHLDMGELRRALSDLGFQRDKKSYGPKRNRSSRSYYAEPAEDE